MRARLNFSIPPSGPTSTTNTTKPSLAPTGGFATIDCTLDRIGLAPGRFCVSGFFGYGEARGEEKMRLVRSFFMRRPLARALGAAVLLLLALPAARLFPQSGDCTFVRGDISGTLPGNEPVVDLNDGVDILAFLFIGRSVPKCLAAADVNDNGIVELSDYTYLVNFLFNGGPPPPPPLPPPRTGPPPPPSPPPAPPAAFPFLTRAR